jgi:serine/threonine-protein kinase
VPLEDTRALRVPGKGKGRWRVRRDFDAPLPEEVIRKFEELGRTGYAIAYRPAVIHALLGDKEMAFAGLEKSFAARDWDIARINVDPFVDSLRDDPRFEDLIKRMGFPR